jgi:hypothetical protein
VTVPCRCDELKRVTAQGPQQAILDELARPAGRWQPGPRSSGGWQSGTVSGGNSFQADLSTVRFVKHRLSQRRQLHFVTFDGTIPHLDDRKVSFNYLFRSSATPKATGDQSAQRAVAATCPHAPPPGSTSPAGRSPPTLRSQASDPGGASRFSSYG